jgi:hypothetical protein
MSALGLAERGQADEPAERVEVRAGFLFGQQPAVQRFPF